MSKLAPGAPLCKASIVPPRSPIFSSRLRIFNSNSAIEESHVRITAVPTSISRRRRAMKLWQTLRTLLPQAIRSWTRSTPTPVTRLEFPRTEIRRILRTREAVAAKAGAETRAAPRGSRCHFPLIQPRTVLLFPFQRNHTTNHLILVASPALTT